MQQNRSLYYAAIMTMIVLLALVIAGCGAPDPSPATSDTPAEESVSAEEEADTEEAEDAEADEEEAEVVDESEAARAQALVGGTFTSDEEVTSLRDESLFGGEYRSVATSDGVSFHPYLTTDTASGGMQASVYTSGLLRLHEETIEYIPNMAESYTISDDGLVFTFKLRETMEWSDGMPITANDFKWTYDQVTNPDNGFPYLSQYEFVTSYEALDDYTLEIKIDEVYAPALGQVAAMITPLPKHIWENLDWDDPETNPEINNPSVISGPYHIAEWKRDQYKIYEANPSYWYHGAPSIERTSTEIVPDQDIAYEKLKSGESDTGTITPENLEEARNLDNISVYEWWPAAARWSYIGLNMREGYATGDVHVRRGINYAIDKELITEEVMLGQAKRTCGPYPETSWVYNPEIECYVYDIDKAVAEFSEAGYTYDADSNQMLDANNEQLTLKLLYGPNTSQTRELMAVTVQDMLSEIGIVVEVQALEWASFLEALKAEEPDWDLSLGGWRATIEPHIMYTIWAEDSIPQLNAVAYINKDVEQLFAEGGATYNIDQRKEKYFEAQRLLVDDAPYVFLFYNKSWSGQNTRVLGIDPKPLGIGWNSEDWYLQHDAGE